MIKEGLKLTYAFGKIQGVRESIKFEIGDIVWHYSISESYRKANPNEKYYKEKCEIIEIQESVDGKHFEMYGIKNLKNGNNSYWYYPTFLEPIN